MDLDSLFEAQKGKSTCLDCGFYLKSVYTGTNFMKNITLICHRQFDDLLVEGKLTLLSNKLHFEAFFPNKQRLDLPLHSIIGINIQESSCLFLLSKTGIIRFFISVNEMPNTLIDFTQKIREYQKQLGQEVSMNSNFEFFLELRYGSPLSKEPCSVVFKEGALLLYSEDKETQTLSFADISKTSIGWRNNHISITIEDKNINFWGTTSFQLFALIDIYQRFGETNNMRTWSDHYLSPIFFSLECFVVQTKNHIHIYPNHFWLRAGIKPYHIPTNQIHELEFQPTFLSFHTAKRVFTLNGISNLGFYRKSCEHIIKSYDLFFQGKWDDIKDTLPKFSLEGTDVSVSSASLWRDDRHIIQGYLILDSDNLSFLPFSDQLDFQTLSINELIRQDDTYTAENILYLRDHDSIYQFICPGDSFTRLFHQQTKLPNRKLFWNELSTASKKRTLHKQRAFLTSDCKTEISLPIEFILNDDQLLAKKPNVNLDFPPAESAIKINFTNAAGRHFFHSKIQMHHPEQQNQAILETPYLISLYSERETRRHPVNIRIAIVPLLEDSEKGEWLPMDVVLHGTLQDISETGCGIAISSEKFEHSRILIELPMPSPLQLVGTISQVQEFIHGGLRLGIAFITDTPSVRFQLRQAINELLSTEIE